VSNHTTPEPAAATSDLPPSWEETARKAGDRAEFSVRAEYAATMRAYEEERKSTEPAYWLKSDPCPAWCVDTDMHRSSDDPDDRNHGSSVHNVELSSMPPSVAFAVFQAPELVLTLVKRHREVEPRVSINDSGDKTNLYATIDEAEQIAFHLLDLVRQARDQEPLKVLPFDSHGTCVLKSDCTVCNVEKTA
jgi:hypothetical protein